MAASSGPLTASRTLARLAAWRKKARMSSLASGLIWVLGASSAAVSAPTSELAPSAAAVAGEAAARWVASAAAACKAEEHVTQGLARQAHGCKRGKCMPSILARQPPVSPCPQMQHSPRLPPARGGRQGAPLLQLHPIGL